jgi:hypothetical protein
MLKYLFGKAATPKQKVVQGLVAALFILGLIGVFLGMKAADPNPGERCNAESCTFGAVCISGFCKKTCSTTADCGADQHCGVVNVTVKTTHHVFFHEESDGKEHICFANPKATSKPRL